MWVISRSAPWPPIWPSFWGQPGAEPAAACRCCPPPSSPALPPTAS
jgi:hypothetical protein